MTAVKKPANTVSGLAAYGFASNDGPPADIFEAAQRGLASYIKKQVDRTVSYDINQRDKFNRTALHWASEMGHIEAAEVLLDYGCKVAAIECNGRTAVHLAARSCDAAMLETLLADIPEDEKAQLVNQADANGVTPVFLALQKGEEGRAVFEFLVANGAKYNDS